MATINARSACLVRYADGEALRETDIAVVERPVPPLAEGQVLVSPLALSVDPYLRSCMTGVDTFFLPQLQLGQPVESNGVATVIESRDPAYRPGDTVQGLFDWADRSIWSGANKRAGNGVLTRIETGFDTPGDLLGVLGVNGLMAYFGVLSVARPRPGETMLISAAAGATGHIAGQIARIIGLRVFGLAGTAEKRRVLVEDLGFEAALDYRSETLADDLRAVLPDGPDIYFDNVGGEVSQTVMWGMRRGARIVESGQIATYDQPGGGFQLDIRPIHAKGLRWQGFVAPHFLEFYPGAIAQLRHWVQTGRIVPLQTEVKGMANAGQALVGVFSGRNIGKMVLTP